MKINVWRRFIFAVIFFTCVLFSFIVNELKSQVRINEVCPINFRMQYDEDYDTPGWIEFYNYSEEAINLKDYKIYNHLDNDVAWIIPDTILFPNEYLILYASAKNRTSSNDLMIEAAGFGYASWTSFEGFRYNYIEAEGDFEFGCKIKSIRNTKSSSRAGIAIREKLSDDSRYVAIFSETQELAGYSVLIRDTVRAYPQKIFSGYHVYFPYKKLFIKRVGDTVITEIRTDDNFCLERTINIFHSNSKVYVGVAFSSANPDNLGIAAVSDIRMNGQELPFSDLQTIEFHTQIIGKNYLSNELHTNFKLKDGSGTLFLWNNTGNLIDSLIYPALKPNNSFGRFAEEDDNFYFEYPSPNLQNLNPLKSITANPDFSYNSGIYLAPMEIEITHDDQETKLFYTTNGNTPDSISSIPYLGKPIAIEQTTVLKAIAYCRDKVPSDVITCTYFIDENVELNVFSISSDSLNFWNETDGLLVIGNNYVTKSIPGYFEYYDNKFNKLYSSGCELKIHENGPAGFNHKSFRIYARESFCNSKFDFPFFGIDYDNEFDKLLIKSAGQDWWRGFMRDELFSVLAKNFPAINGAEYKPVKAYINGKFWGLYNLRERIDEEYILRKYNLKNKDEVNLMEDGLFTNWGSCKSFFMAYDSIISTNDYDKKYEIAERHFDLENVNEYFIIEFYSGNWDWLGWNQKFWSSSELDGKWRWILWDLDWSIGYDYTCKPNNNIIKRVEERLQKIPNNLKVEEIFFHLLKNNDYRNRFLNRMTDVLNSNFTSQNVTNVIDSLAAQIRKPVIHQQQRWPESCQNWESSIQDMRNYANLRPYYLCEQLVEHFQLTGTSKLTLKKSDNLGGKFKLNTLEINENIWQGIYFNDIPIKLTAIPNKGYKFVAWSDTSLPQIPEIELTLSDSIELIAYFVDTLKASVEIVINEIMYKSSNNFDTKDWIEIYNPGELEVNLKNWSIKDDNKNHVFNFSNNLTLKPNHYLIVCEDTSSFLSIHSDSECYLGDLGFGLGTEDMVILLDDKGNLIDFVPYSYEYPWPQDATGTGKSIELKNPEYDNLIPENWQSSLVDKGTPGRKNSVTNYYNDIIQNINFSIYPNPFSESTKFKFYLVQPANVNLTIYNSLSQEISVLCDEWKTAGEHVIYFNGSNLNSGIYYYKFSFGSENHFGKVVLIR